MIKNLKKLTNDQLTKKRDKLVNELILCEQDAQCECIGPCGPMVDYDLLNEYYHDQITDLIDVLLEIMKRTDYLQTR